VTGEEIERLVVANEQFDPLDDPQRVPSRAPALSPSS
jgi:hypothetical protein